MKKWLFASILLIASALGAWLLRSLLDDRDWRSAVSVGTHDALSAYLKDHPHGRHLREANAQLEEERDFDRLVSSDSWNSTESLQGFLKDHAGGANAPAVEGRLVDLKAQKDWVSLPRPRTAENLENYLKQYPSGLYSEYARKLLKEMQTDPREREKQGTDLDMIVQIAADGAPAAHAGVTIASGQRASFDSRGQLAPGTAGYWKGLSSRRFTVLAEGADGQRGALFELGSTVRWGPDGNITEGEENILRVSTTDNQHYLEITSRYFKNGRLHLLTADGSDFSFYDPSPNWSAKVQLTR